MRHPIDPKIDCVFKALLGAERRQALLIHFLNAMLASELPAPIVSVTILNPYNEREYLDDKLSIVDVKARDDQGRLYQIEIQLLAHRDMPARMLYGWADLYSSQLQEGEHYTKLKPTYAIWLLAAELLSNSQHYRHLFHWRDAHGCTLIDHGGIAVLELSKFHSDAVSDEQQRWLKFFKDGATLDSDHLPEWMQTPEMEQAMSVLRGFSDKERAYHAYQARQNYLRVQMSLQEEFNDLKAESARARAQMERAQIEAERAQAAWEQERVAREHAQATAEQAQATAEQAQATAEQAQATAEQAQATAEQERIAREYAQATAEQAQATAEQERIAREHAQATAEQALAELEQLKARLRDQDI